MAPTSEIIKVSLTLGSATLNIEGDKETVTKEMTRFYELFGSHANQPDHDVARTERGGVARTRTSVARSSRKGSGTSCASRIEGLLAASFFDRPRTIRETVNELDTKATPYPLNHVGAALQQLTRRSTLRRMKRDSGWVYMKP